MMFNGSRSLFLFPSDTRDAIAACKTVNLRAAELHLRRHFFFYWDLGIWGFGDFEILRCGGWALVFLGGSLTNGDETKRVLMERLNR